MGILRGLGTFISRKMMKIYIFYYNQLMKLRKDPPPSKQRARFYSKANISIIVQLANSRRSYSLFYKYTTCRKQASLYYGPISIVPRVYKISGVPIQQKLQIFNSLLKTFLMLKGLLVVGTQNLQFDCRHLIKQYGIQDTPIKSFLNFMSATALFRDYVRKVSPV